MACEMTGRACYGIEIDPGYVDVVIERYKKLTDRDVTKITEGTPNDATGTG